MKKTIIAIAVVAAAALVCGSAYAVVTPKAKSVDKVKAFGSGSSSAEGISVKKKTMVENEVLVSFRKTVNYQNRLSALGRMNVTRVKELSSGNRMAVKIADGETVASAVARLKKDPTVESVQPNYIYHAFASIVNDTSYSSQWALRNSGQTIASPSYSANNPGTAGKDMDFTSAYAAVGSDAESVIVAVVDSGVKYDQEDLVDNMWDGSSAGFANHGYDCVGSNDNDPMDMNGHGTHVAGIIAAAANNGKGVAGIGYNAKIMAVRVLDATGSGTTADIVEGINWAVAHGAKVINMSLGGSTYDAAFYNALAAARDAGVIVACAAGNDGLDIDSTSNQSYPAEYDLANIITVGAVDQAYAAATFSNTGVNSVDIAAPGTNILSTWPGTNASYSSTASDWSGSITSGTGWAGGTLVGYACFQNPTGWNGTATYTSGEYSCVYRNYGTVCQSADVVTISYVLNLSLAQYDRVHACVLNGTTPYCYLGAFAQYYSYSGGISTGGEYYTEEYDITSAAKGSANCMVSFWLKDDASTAASYGCRVVDPIVNTLTYNTTSYNTIDGTSMATPYVAGLAALVKGFNPDYTWQDVRDSVISGADEESGLTTAFNGGKVADAYGSIKYIKQPEGLTVE